MVNKAAIILAVLAAVFLTACASNQSHQNIVGSSQTVYYVSPTGSNGTFNGVSTFAFANQTTYPLSIKYGTEYGLWYSCSNLNVSTFYYSISPDGNLWTNGTTSLNACKDNTTYIVPAMSGAEWVRFGIKATNTTNGNISSSANFTIILGVK